MAIEIGIALRAAPREPVTLRHRIKAPGTARTVEIARAGYAGTWQVPLWHMAAPVGAQDEAVATTG